MPARSDQFTPEQHRAAQREFFARHVLCCVADPNYVREVKSYNNKPSPYPPGVVKPTPVWLQEMRERHEREAKMHAGPHVRPKADAEQLPPWVEATLDELPSAAQTFARAAVKAGLEVAYRRAGARAAQVGIARRVAGHERPVMWMRATWSRTATGSWTTKGVSVHDEAGPQHLGTTAAKALW